MSFSLLANASCVAVAGRGILILGPPGSGKSRLALRLIDRGAMLVGDDGVRIERRGARLWAHPPPTIAGMLEIRGVGIAAFPAGSVSLCLALDLAASAERLPDPGVLELEGHSLPCLGFSSAMDALEAEWALRLHGLASAAAGA